MATGRYYTMYGNHPLLEAFVTFFTEQNRNDACAGIIKTELH